MSAQRIRGEDSSVVIIVDGQPVNTITAIKDFNVEFDLDILSEAYLGEHGERQDDHYKSVGGDFTVHHETPAVMDLINAIVDRASRKNPLVIFNLRCTYTWPNGSKRRFTAMDCAFGPLPISNGGQGEYISTKLTWKASQYTLK